MLTYPIPKTLDFRGNGLVPHHPIRKLIQDNQQAAFFGLLGQVSQDSLNVSKVHGFLWQGQDGWVLSPVYDLNPTPVDVRPRILTTNISLDEATCDINLVLSVAEYFNLSQGAAKIIIREVAAVTSTWSLVAGKFGLRSAEIKRMESAFEHEDLKRALKI